MAIETTITTTKKKAKYPLSPLFKKKKEKKKRKKERKKGEKAEKQHQKGTTYHKRYRQHANANRSFHTKPSIMLV